jgi:adenine-specific DNA-methyltransferase
MIEKLKMKTADLSQVNIEKIAELFPTVITEIKDENGELKRAVDFDLLKQALSDVLVEGEDERYRLDWPGKKASLLKANTPINKTLRPCKEESVNFDTTENLYIEGDNFEVLKILQESYLGKIKMIYIDPPYNTGHDFIYKDDYTITKAEYEEELGARDEEGVRFFKNTDSNGRFHSDWLSMMYERLIIARDLLKDDGVIFISIDDNEVHNLRKICDDVFGEGNFINQIAIKLSEPTGVKMAHVKKRLPKLKEYILLYQKVQSEFTPVTIKKDKWDDEYKHVIGGITDSEIEIIQNTLSADNVTDEDIKNADEICKRINLLSIDSLYEKGKTYTAEESDEIRFKNAHRILRDVATSYGAKQIADKKRETTSSPFFLIRTQEGKVYLIKNGYNLDSDQPRIKMLFASDYLCHNVGDFWFDIKTTGLDNEGFVEFKNGKKPLKLISRLIELSTEPGDLVLDFFSGSSSTAHSVLEVNLKEKKDLKFIMIQLPENLDKTLLKTLDTQMKKQIKSTIEFLDSIDKPHLVSEIGKERIRRAGKKILEELKTKNMQLKLGEEPRAELDIGFRVYKLDSSNMKDIYYHPSKIDQKQLSLFTNNIKEDRTPEDLLSQIILDLGLELHLKIESKNIYGNNVYFVETNSLVACFDEAIDFRIVDEIAQSKPLKVVFRDASFKNDKDRINLEERFKRLSAETIIKVI